MADSNNLASLLERQVETYVDGDLPDASAQAFEQAMADNPSLARAVQQARRIKATLRATPDIEPSAEFKERLLGRVLGAVPYPRQRRKGLSLAIAASLMALVTTIGLLVTHSDLDFNSLPPLTPTPNSAEVSQALAGVQLTLGYLAKLSSETGKTVEDVVVSESLLQPVSKGIFALGPHSEEKSS